MSGADVGRVRSYVLGRLERELDPRLTYHRMEHTRDDVVPAALRLAALHGLGDAEVLLLETAALLHDLGFVERRAGHEHVGVAVAREILPACGFTGPQIDVVASTIMATKLPQSPATLVERLLADADLDVLGRPDFFDTNDALRAEMTAYGEFSGDDDAWYGQQLVFLTEHVYFTDVATTLRAAGKELNAREMRRRLRH